MYECAGLRKVFVFSLIAFFLTIAFSEYAFSRAGRRSSGSSRSYSRSSSYRSSYSSRPSYSSRSYGSSYGSSSYGRRHYSTSRYGSSSSDSSAALIILATIVIMIIVAVVWSIFSSAKSSYSAGGYSGSGGYGGSGYSSFSRPPSSFSGYGSGGGRISDPDAERRIREIFMQVQQGWMERNPYISQRYMSERLFSEQSDDIQEMIDDGVRNILENITIVDIKITEKSGSYSSGRMAAYITASMIDYEVDENTGSVVGGDRNFKEEFTELWRFVGGPDGWVADEIDA